MGAEDEMALSIKLVKSRIGAPQKLQKVIVGLGLNKTNVPVIRKDTPAIRGMIFKIKHLVEVTEVADESPQSAGRK
jgi:large subunit ribosomal protein L30